VNPFTDERAEATLDALLEPSDLRVDAVQPMDLFLHTLHVETVVRLTHSRIEG